MSALVSMSVSRHAHLDRLRALFTNQDFEFGPRYRELGPVYEGAAVDVP